MPLPAHFPVVPHPEIVDARTGIVRSLRAADVPPSFPPQFDLVTATLSDTTRFAPWAADPAGAGHGFADPDAVLGAAVGEAVERYCGNAVPDDLPTGTARDLRAAGHDVVDLDSLALYSAAQHADPTFPAARLHDDLVVEWARARDARTGEGVLVPASLVWPAHVTARADRTDGAPTNTVVQAGLAAGPTRDRALAAGLREVVERDAMTLSWYGERGVRHIDTPRWLTEFSRGPRGDLETRYLHLHQEFGLPVLACLVRDRSTGYLSLGTGAADDPVDAALKSFSEALQLQLVLRDHDDPTTALAQAGDAPGSPLAPWRADRGYADSYRRDRRDVVDYACHLQLHLDPRVQREFEDRLARLDRGSVALGEVRADGPGPAAALDRSGFRRLEVDLTTDDVRACGLHVVRVLVPGLYSNAPVGLPFLGGTRLGLDVVTTVPLPH